jgi:hypothetical protein
MGLTNSVRQEEVFHGQAVTQSQRCARRLLDRSANVFGGADPPKPVDLQPLLAKMGQLRLENNFLERTLTKVELLNAR